MQNPQPTDPAECPAANPPDTLMNWSIKARLIAPRDLRNGILAMTIAVLGAAGMFSWLGADKWVYGLCAVMYVLMLLLLTVRTHLSFQLTRDGITISKYVRSDRAARITIVVVVVIEALLMLWLAVATGTWWLLLTPLFIAYILFTREMVPPSPEACAKHEHGPGWEQYRYLTIDRKRRILVPHISNLSIGFELRLPDIAMFEQCLALLRELLPAEVEYLERDWEFA
ncbi:hypothetical protein SAMN05216487_4080 [Pseudomonas sp. UC 17F4]|uniref:hypothetical protein n=1 Tax=Pseudomonas sp. UC 17F4 TaxID=1855328 RepID=UPI000885050A|nr:hypothetical protein [Pseudomonas sp. UC 17F4]SDQ82053.1 hypothetical protein SAMN05216487_4080 [Pseudomonas sp. UC 17F4]